MLDYYEAICIPFPTEISEFGKLKLLQSLELELSNTQMHS
jgi:hypothetical protein